MLAMSDDSRSDSAPQGRVFAILLAAGFSSRFGDENKLLVPFRGKPLARHTMDLVCGLGGNCFDGIFFIYSDERAAALTKNMPDAFAQRITLIYNAAPERGQRESVRLGVLAAKACENDYFFFFPCDQPLLDEDTLRRILAVRKKGRIVEPRCLSTRNNLDIRHGRENGESQLAAASGEMRSAKSPSLFSAVFLDELLSLREGEAPRVIKARRPQAVFPVMVSNPLVLADIDDRETLMRLNGSNSAPSAPFAANAGQ
jgi:CTP:molybdopterin cytidylyltransferase MocA